MNDEPSVSIMGEFEVLQYHAIFSIFDVSLLSFISCNQ